MNKKNSIEHKCIACYGTKIINKGTKVEEKCPICDKKEIKIKK
jgi:rubrerythrin